MLRIAPSIPITCQNPSYSPFTKERESQSAISCLYLQLSLRGSRRRTKQSFSNRPHGSIKINGRDCLAFPIGNGLAMANDEAFIDETSQNISIQLAVSALPLIGKPDKLFITMLPDIFGSLPVFAVFIPVPAVESPDYRAGRVIGAIGAGFQLFIAKAAVFNGAAGFGNIPFAAVIAQLAATASAFGKRYYACPAISSAAPDFPYRHFICLTQRSLKLWQVRRDRHVPRGQAPIWQF